LNKNESPRDELRSEELRGLFILGLLAILVSYRVQNERIIVTIRRVNFNIIPLLDITIIFWVSYAFLMVVGVLEDIVGKTISRVFREFSVLFLTMDFWSLGFYFF